MRLRREDPLAEAHDAHRPELELAHRPEIPTGAIISEAVELAKSYSTDDSGRFVNGMLGRIAEELRPEE